MENQGMFDYIKTGYKRSGAIGQLIAVNIGVHLVFGIIYVIDKLFLNPTQQYPWQNIANIWKSDWMAAPGDPSLLLYKPWTLITQLFTHGDFMHLLFNLIMFYFTARIFVQFFGERRLISTYFLSGIFAYLFHIGCYYLIPAFKTDAVNGLIGASGAIMAIFFAIAVHRPNFKVLLYGLIKVPLILLAALYVFYDLRNVFEPDKIGHIAHLGGALFGALSVLQINSPNNFMNMFDKWWSKIKWPSFKRKPKMKVYKTEARNMNDEEYNASKLDYQKRVDAILDKISKRGYESLSKEEKNILFNESKKK